MNYSTAEVVPETPATAGGSLTQSFAQRLDRVLTGCLFLLVFCAPHSIAATQIAWSLGLLVWAVRFFVRPRPRFYRTPVDYALLGFFILTFVSALCSYDPIVSIGKLRAASLFTIVYLVAENVRTQRTLRRLALVLVASCMLNVFYTIGAYSIGRGVKVQSMPADSPLRASGVVEGDTILKVDEARVRTPSEIEHALGLRASDAPPARLHIYRHETLPIFDLSRTSLLQGTTPEARLGLTSWTHGRDERAEGFYDHYTTYAEVLQLLASLAVGLLIALRQRRTRAGALLALAIAGMSFALMLTVTRASWLAFLVSVCVMVLAGVQSRRVWLLFALGALLVIPLGLYELQQKRQVSFFDPNDDSINWRKTVYREGFNLLIEKPRHLIVGVGMDSIKRHYLEWGLFDHGKMPIGHMHSTPLQLALERGVPALLLWLMIVFIYARMLWRLARGSLLEDWVERGIALGALGGLVGFFTSGLVHYNLGDSEVAMVFYLIMGLALIVERFAREKPVVETASL